MNIYIKGKKSIFILTIIMISVSLAMSGCKKDDETDQIDPPPPGDAVLLYQNLIMGSFNDANYGSFLNCHTGAIMNTNDAIQFQDAVDLVFYLGAINGVTLGAPSDTTVQDIFELYPPAWNVFNTTLLMKADITVGEFNAIGSSVTFPEFTGNDDDINLLNANDIVYFKTMDSKLGYIKINSVNAKGDVMNIDLIIME